MRWRPMVSGDTRVHYVTGHLHPFGTSLRLVEMESGRTVCEILGESFEDRLGVAHMSQISSSEGIPLGRGKRYELIAEYDNRSTGAIDAMAILYLYAAAAPPAAGESLAKAVE